LNVMPFKNLSKKQKRDRIQVINTTIEELADKLEAEKRALTPEEITERDSLVQERELLKLELAREAAVASIEPEKTRGMAFDELIDGIKSRNIPEEYRSVVESDNVILLRDVQHSSTVGAITPLTIGDIIKPLEKGLILDKVGAKMQYGMDGAWQFPIVAGVEAKVVGEDVSVSDSKINIDKITPKPKRVSIRVPVTYQAQNRSAGKLFNIVTEQIAMSLTRVLNKWMFDPTALSGTDGGCFVNPSTKITFTGNAWKDAIRLKGEVMKTGVVFDGTPAYVCSATKYAELESTPRDAGSGLMVIENGKINGFPVFITEYIGDGVLGFGIFSYMLVGQFGTVRLTVDPYTQADKDRIVFTLNTDFDMLPLRPEAFGILSDTPTT
jgi:HK97 family phage major capsid protein